MLRASSTRDSIREKPTAAAANAQTGRRNGRGGGGQGELPSRRRCETTAKEATSRHRRPQFQSRRGGLRRHESGKQLRLFPGCCNADPDARRWSTGWILERNCVYVPARHCTYGEAVRLIEMIKSHGHVAQFLNHGIAHRLQTDNHPQTQNRRHDQKFGSRYEAEFVIPETAACFKMLTIH